MLIILTASAYVYVNRMNADSVRFEIGSDAGGGDENPYIAVRMENSENKVRMWQDEEGGRAYFFLPSCVNHHRVKFDNLGNKNVRIDGKLFEEGDLFTWEEDREYQMNISDEAYDVRTYSLTFMKSENIPAVFIETESGSMEYLHEDKHNEETGNICVVREDGSTEYQGKLERISGRGNATWKFEKKPYAIKLSEDYPLCGLDKGDRWRLLALWIEGSRMDNKIAMDLAEQMRLEYSVQGTWVDLYLNGEYAGNYLLAESVSVGEGRVDIYDLEKDNKQYNEDIEHAATYEEEDNKGYLIDNGSNITGGYLIEKDGTKYYEAEVCGFVTSMGNPFTIKSPRHASKEQVLYIQDYVNNIDRIVQNRLPEVWEYLDLDSFAKRFLLDEISLNMDTAVASMYFYKEKDDDKLYSGPGWDYDNAFGDGGTNQRGHNGYDYGHSVLEDFNVDESERLNWYVVLYDFPEVQQSMIEEYKKLLPYFEELLDYGIDEYADLIGASVKMDRIMWIDNNENGDPHPGKCEDYYANIKYMKYFIAKRLNFLCDRWGVEHEEFAVPSSGEMHTVTFANYEGVIDTMEIMDGAELENPLEYDESVYQGWENQFNGEIYRKQIPIYEDTVFYNPRWG